jgi:hypothetical protein
MAIWLYDRLSPQERSFFAVRIVQYINDHRLRVVSRLTVARITGRHQ